MCKKGVEKESLLSMKKIRNIRFRIFFVNKSFPMNLLENERKPETCMERVQL